MRNAVSVMLEPKLARASSSGVRSMLRSSTVQSANTNGNGARTVPGPGVPSDAAPVENTTVPSASRTVTTNDSGASTK